MPGILIYSDRSDFALELLTAAQILSGELGLAVQVLSINDEEQAERLEKAGADVYQIKTSALSMADTAALAAVVQQAAEKLSVSMVLLSSNRRGKELAGRLAQKMGAGCLTDVHGLQVKDQSVEWVRNTLGGATVSTQVITTAIKVAAITPRSFEAAAAGAGGRRQALDIQPPPATITLMEARAKSTDVVDIQNAEVLVVVGQGVEKEDLPQAQLIAELLGGEIACSKPVATDKKWLPEERIVGLSGKKCKPQLAIILGTSGQVQFTVGIREAQTIVAVNNDENAYMLKMADFAMVADAKQVIAELAKALST